MKLYDWKGAPNPRRVLIFLKEKAIEMPVIDAGTDAGARLSDEYLADHSQRLVPVLELDDGTQIGEAMAICRYLESIHPEPPLMGSDALERARIDMWERRADMEGIGAASELFRNSHPAFAGRGLPGRAERIEQIPELVERGGARMTWFIEKFDAQIGDSPFITSADFTTADITAFCAMNFAEKVCKVRIPESCVNFTRWYEAVSARPSVARKQ
ncbi:MAG: glutathione S-transferase [Alphaproteobacteria bacterium]|jgi:glutathione S-transferase|nr:glutathione S-transferase [Alphaproteobacteria bacterium]